MARFSNHKTPQGGLEILKIIWDYKSKWSSKKKNPPHNIVTFNKSPSPCSARTQTYFSEGKICQSHEIFYLHLRSGWLYYSKSERPPPQQARLIFISLTSYIELQGWRSSRGQFPYSDFCSSLRITHPSLEQVRNSSLILGCQQPLFSMAVWPCGGEHETIRLLSATSVPQAKTTRVILHYECVQ